MIDRDLHDPTKKPTDPTAASDYGDKHDADAGGFGMGKFGGTDCSDQAPCDGGDKSAPDDRPSV